MQDVCRDEFPTLNGGDAGSNFSEKDISQTLLYKTQNSALLSPSVASLPKQSNEVNNESLSSVAVKLEEINTIDLFPSSSSNWQQYQIHDMGDHRLFLDSRNSFDRNGTKLLLQGSDDPLISHGANSVMFNDDEHPADFAKSLVTPANNHFQNTAKKQETQAETLSKFSNNQEASPRIIKSGCSNLTRQQLKAKANLMSARNQQQQNQNITLPLNIPTAASTTSPKNQLSPKTKIKKATTVKLRFHHQALPPEYLSHYEATQGQQRVCRQTNNRTSTARNPSKTTNAFQKQSQPRNSHENVRSWLQKIAEIQRTANASKRNDTSHAEKPTDSLPQKSNAMHESGLQNTFSNLSTDANNNYAAPKINFKSNHSTAQEGGVLDEVNHGSTSKASHYSDLPYMGEITLDNCKPRRGRKPKKADICHLIYKNYGTILNRNAVTESPNSNYTSNILNIKNQSFKKNPEDQPLNLCLRDQLNDTYSISSGDELSETNSSCPTPVITPFDYIRDTALASNLSKSLGSTNEANDFKVASNTSTQRVSPNTENSQKPNSMCFKNLLETETLLPNNSSGHYNTTKQDNPVTTNILLPQSLEKCLSSPDNSNLDKAETLQTRSSGLTESCPLTVTNMNPNQQLVAPQKRKRSAIFIPPPMNTENTNNPATEVSICKFKFTGGSKPTLQEKKMISVDAGGNYRYYSGTGDKASRGYEYFPRESLQHTAGLIPGVNCTGQKLSMDLPPTSLTLNNDLQITQPSTSSALLSGQSFNVNADMTPKNPSSSSNSTAATFEVSKNEACSLSIKENSSYLSSSPLMLQTNFYTAQPKKKSVPQQVKKLSQKEKLQKTFREKGFLIQTQHLESAEGVTYCKFRQLKKFTRYLFRNWKDYLPSGIQENSNMAELASNTNVAAIKWDKDEEHKTACNK